MAPVYLTRDGLERLARRIEDARAAYRAVCNDNPAAAEAGDSSVWHDNFAYEENQRKMHMLAARVRELELLRDRAVVVSPPSHPDAVALGTRVVYRVGGDDAVRSCVLGGFDDGDVDRGRISYNSPLGSQLIGSRAGDFVEVRIGGRVLGVEIVEISGVEEVRCAG